MRAILLIGLVVCFCKVASAQESEQATNPIFKTWISLSDSTKVVKGLLYEVGDSSVFVKKSISSEDILEYHFTDIELLKVRRNNSIWTGITAGSMIGASSGVLYGLTYFGEASVISIVPSAIFGLSFGFLGAGVGTLVSSVKDRFPLNGSSENFEKYRGNLQGYSYKIEEKRALHKFVHRATIGISMGVSFAKDEFAFDLPVANYPGMKMNGQSGNTLIGYRFTEHIGVNFQIRNSQYTALVDNLPLTYWNLDAFTAGPVFSLPISEKLRFDFSPSAGFATAYFMLDNKEVYTGRGFGINMNAALAYLLSKRWILSTSAGFLSAKQEYKQGGSGKASDRDIQLGLAYQFGKRGL